MLLNHFAAVDEFFNSTYAGNIRVAREESLGQRQFEELRIVPDALWYAAQKHLLAAPKNGGAPAGGGRKSRPRPLNGLFVCPAHGRPLSVGGAHAKVMSAWTQGLPA